MVIKPARKCGTSYHIIIGIIYHSSKTSVSICYLFLPSSISGPTALLRLLLVAAAAVVACPPPCRAADDPADMQLPVTPQATPTPLWAVDWGPTQPLEDETHHFLSSQESEGGKQATPEVDAWSRRRNAQSNQTQQQPLSIDAKDSGKEQERDAEEREIEEGGHRDGTECPLNHNASL